MLKHSVLSAQELPPNFKYPPSYVEFFTLPQQELNLDPWWFLCLHEQATQDWFVELKRQYPNRSLIPFAKLSYNDDVACFDGHDASGNPKVHYVHAFARDGWEDRGNVADFTAWLNLAKQESLEYKAEFDSNGDVETHH